MLSVSKRDVKQSLFNLSSLSLDLNKYHLDAHTVKTVQKLTPKHANTENQIRSNALERSVI